MRERSYDTCSGGEQGHLLCGLKPDRAICDPLTAGTLMSLPRSYVESQRTGKIAKQAARLAAREWRFCGFVQQRNRRLPSPSPKPLGQFSLCILTRFTLTFTAAKGSQHVTVDIQGEIRDVVHHRTPLNLPVSYIAEMAPRSRWHYTVVDETNGELRVLCRRQRSPGSSVLPNPTIPYRHWKRRQMYASTMIRKSLLAGPRMLHVTGSPSCPLTELCWIAPTWNRAFGN